uniref:BPTI/Kunitz inhibitor domain-containing protein n=1 Tax=Amblyomma cajennense TaxID=34607 RepID=A0A023FC17_AMBCJ
MEIHSYIYVISLILSVRMPLLRSHPNSQALNGQQTAPQDSESGTPANTSLRCSLGPVNSRCRASLTVWYYNSTLDVCSQFTYGGCGASASYFDTCEECMKNCSHNENRTVICQQLEEEAEEEYEAGWYDYDPGDNYTAPPFEEYNEEDEDQK